MENIRALIDSCVSIDRLKNKTFVDDLKKLSDRLKIVIIAHTHIETKRTLKNELFYDYMKGCATLKENCQICVKDTLEKEFKILKIMLEDNGLDTVDAHVVAYACQNKLSIWTFDPKIARTISMIKRAKKYRRWASHAKSVSVILICTGCLHIEPLEFRTKKIVRELRCKECGKPLKYIM